jgi:predicted ATPase/DNA-binding winged helix-turn-helix (wHTH) protein
MAFGPFRLLPEQQQLLEADKPVRLGSRALEILNLLLERPGELVTKDELIARVWPSTLVEEGSLRVHVAALRRTLGDGQGANRYIINVPGRGYRFVAPVSHASAPRNAEPAPVPAADAHDVPTPLSRMVGRTEIVDVLVARLPQQRLITIAGPGGIGKTTVAVAVAEAASGSYVDGVRLVDLTPLADPDLVPSALASALGIAIRSENPVPSLVAYLAGKSMLIVLDSCEHVIAAAAAMASALVNGTSTIHVLATSREPLRVQCERVHRLAALEVPPVSTGLTAAAALAFPAVQLFAERAAASQDTFELSDADAAIVADICRRLDGIALAIELAASRVDMFGVRGVDSRLDDQFNLLTRGRRTALPRHQTLAAAFDWSYDLLPAPESAVLRRLAIFAGAFSLESASSVASNGGGAAIDVVDCVANLVAKSLIVADISGSAVSYRLLNTTRAYALEKLAASGDLAQTAGRHARHVCDQYRGFLPAWEMEPTAEWLAARRRDIDNVRAALDRSFSADGDADIGVALVIAATPLWLYLSLINECRKRVEQAMAHRGASDPRRDMQLFAALGSTLIYTSMGPAAHQAWTSAFELAEDLGDTGYQLRALWGLWIDRLNTGAFRESLAVARRFRDTAHNSAEPMDVLMGDRIIGVSQHFLGEQAEALRHIERMLQGYVSPSRQSHIARFQFDQYLTARCFHARILWTQGFPDQAMRIVEEIVEEGRSIGHALSLCNALGQGVCVVARFCGELDAAERYVAILLQVTAQHSLTLWNTWGRCFEGVVIAARGNVAGGLKQLRGVLAEFPETRAMPRYLGLYAELARLLSINGEMTQALAVIDEAIMRVEQNQEYWGFAEVLRIKGRLLQHQNAPEAAEAYLLQSLEWTRRHQTLSFELRTAVSLAKLRRQQGRRDEALALLTPINRRFTEGFGTTDLIAAKGLIDELT